MAESPSFTVPARVDALVGADAAAVERWATSQRDDLLARREELARLQGACADAVHAAASTTLPAALASSVDGMLVAATQRLADSVEQVRTDAEAVVVAAIRAAAEVINEAGADAVPVLRRIAPAMPTAPPLSSPRSAAVLWAELGSSPRDQEAQVSLDLLDVGVADQSEGEVFERFWSDAARADRSVRDRLRSLAQPVSAEA